ncbi:MAG: hypothetical protein AB8I08_13085 [Sandaracinaceae bacterium]
MQTAGRTCGGCETKLEVLGDGDGCAACDVMLCNGCLDGSDRCPSCQRPFDETRGAAPAIARDSLGARQLRAVSVTLLGSIVLMAVLGAIPVSTTVVNLVLVSLLLMWTSRGGTWSRWVLVVLVALGAASHGMAVAQGQGWGQMVSVAMVVLYVGCALALAFSPAIHAHVRAQALAQSGT